MGLRRGTCIVPSMLGGLFILGFTCVLSTSGSFTLKATIRSTRGVRGNYFTYAKHASCGYGLTLLGLRQGTIGHVSSGLAHFMSFMGVVGFCGARGVALFVYFLRGGSLYFTCWLCRVGATVSARVLPCSSSMYAVF